MLLNSSLNRKSGRTYEKQLVIAILAILVAILIPKLVNYRLKLNEEAAILRLNEIFGRQQLFQKSKIKDQNKNGQGEYGTLKELSQWKTQPSLNWDSSQEKETKTLFEKAGYYFLIYLPKVEQTDKTKENWSPKTEIDFQEQYWICYAWPISEGSSGRRCFAINQKNQIYVSRAHNYSNATNIPSPEACFLKENVSTTEGKKLSGVIDSPSFDSFHWHPLKTTP